MSVDAGGGAKGHMEKVRCFALFCDFFSAMASLSNPLGTVLLMHIAEMLVQHTHHQQLVCNDRIQEAGVTQEPSCLAQCKL